MKLKGQCWTLPIPAFSSIAATRTSCLCWWIINRGYWSPWQNNWTIAQNVISFMGCKKKKTLGQGYKCPLPLRACYSSEVTPRFKTLWHFGPKFLTEPGTATATRCQNPWGVLWSWWWGAFDLCALLCHPSMCTGGCARCLGGTLIPLAVFAVLANILLFFPGGKVVDDNSHLSDEVWYFGGILGSGVLVSRKTLVPQRRIPPLSSASHSVLRAWDAILKLITFCVMKSSALIYFPFLFVAEDSLVY